MRKIKEVLRLRYDLGLLQNEIARSCSIAQSSVHRYLERATAAGLSWPLPEDCDDRRLNELLFPVVSTGGSPPAREPVDFAKIHLELQSNKHVTLQLQRSLCAGRGTARSTVHRPHRGDLPSWKPRGVARAQLHG